MMINVVTLAFLAALPNPFRDLPFFHPHDVHTSRYGIQGWRLDVHKDGFAEHTACELQRGPVSVRRGVATFRFGDGVDTANAVMRVDGGPPQNVGLHAVEAAGLGAPMLGGDLGNPSGGRVAVPLRLVAGAHEVDLRPVKWHDHRQFKLDGLEAALQAAQGQGCDIAPQTPPPVRP